MDLDAPQQCWGDENNPIMQTALFGGQQMMAIQIHKSDDEPVVYELHFLGLKVLGFDTINVAKASAPKFAKDVFAYLSMMITD